MTVQLENTCEIFVEVRIQSWADNGKMKCVNSATPGPMKMNQSYKSREPDAIKQPNRRERIKGGTNKCEYQQKTSFRQVCEESAHRRAGIS